MHVRLPRFTRLKYPSTVAIDGGLGEMLPRPSPPWVSPASFISSATARPSMPRVYITHGHGDHWLGRPD